MMRTIIWTISVKNISKFSNTLHMSHLRIKNHGSSLLSLQIDHAINYLLRDFAQTISKVERDKGFARLDVYKKWFEDSFLAANDNNTLVIMPQDFMRPRYRDEVPRYVDTKVSCSYLSGK